MTNRRYRGVRVECMSTDHIANALAYAIRTRRHTESIPALYEELGFRLQHFNNPPVEPWDLGGEIPF